MRLAVCALSAVLMSGCSWLGTGGSSAGSYGSGVYGADCGGYGSTGVYNVGAAGCGGAGGYGVGAGYGQAGYGVGAGYGQAGYGAGAGFGQAGYGAGAGFGQAGYGAGVGYGATGFGAGTGYNSAALGLGAASAFGATGGFGQTTTLGTNAPFGSAVGTQFGGTQFGTQGQFAQGNVTTVAGAPIYVPQPYPAYYGVPQLRGVPVAVGGGALPFGIEAGIGTAFALNGDVFDSKRSGFASDGSGGVSDGRFVSEIDDISYGDAFDDPISYNVAATYDISPSTTLLGQFSYAEADGNNVQIGNVTEGGREGALFAEFSDLEQYTIEGGVRQYLGDYRSVVRPYVAGTAGVTYTDDVDLTQSSSAFLNGVDPTIESFIDSGWEPTAAGLVGAEMQVGGRSAIGIESGIRWTDNSDSLLGTDDRWSIPLRLRGRVSF